MNVTDEADFQVNGFGLFRATWLGICRAEYLVDKYEFGGHYTDVVWLKAVPLAHNISKI